MKISYSKYRADNFLFCAVYIKWNASICVIPPCRPWKGRWILRSKRRKGLSHIYVSIKPQSRWRSCRYGTSFVLSDKGSKALFFCWHGSYLFEYTLSPPATPDYEADLFPSLYELTTITCSLHFILFAPAFVCCFRSGQVPLQFTPEPVDALWCFLKWFDCGLVNWRSLVVWCKKKEVAPWKHLWVLSEDALGASSHRLRRRSHRPYRHRSLTPSVSNS